MCFVHHGLADEPFPFAEPGTARHYAPDRVVRITHADVRLAIGLDDETFSGEATFSLVPLPTFRGRFSFDLDDVEVDAVTDAAGAALDWRHVGGRIEISAPEVPGAVVVRWHGARPVRGLYFTGPTAAHPDRPVMAWTQCQDEDGHFVFPCHDHPGVKHPWTLEVSAALGTTLLSNGIQVDGGDREGRSWARYEQEHPMPAYLVTFVAARLARVDASWRGRPVRYFVPHGDEALVERAFGRTPDMMEHFSQLLGVDYAWPRYDQVVVHDFVFGGMENVACTTMTELLLADERAALESRATSLVAHELAHQWFGNLVTCQDWSQGWLNESWATYMEALWTEHDRPQDEAIWYRWETAQGYHDEAAQRYRRPIVSYDFREPIDVFDRHLYNKGSCVLWTLRHQLGDAPFWAGVRLYLERHRHQTAHTRHFQRALEDASGTNLDGFFHQWVYTAGHPTLDVRLGRDGDDLAVTVKQTHEGEPFAHKLQLDVVLEDGSEQTVRLSVESRERTWVVPVSGAISHVRVDPGYRVLAQLKLSGPDGWLMPLLQGSCPVLALRAARALMKADGRRGVDAVYKAQADHPFYGVRAALAGLVAGRGTRDARDALTAQLDTETEPRVLRALVTALATFRDAEMADRALQMLDGDLPTWHVHGALLLALGRTGDPRAVPALRAALSTPSWADLICQRALVGLAHTRDPAVLDDLLAHTQPRFGDRTRAVAANALGLLADVSEAPVRRAAVERLVELLPEGGFRTQLSAIAALARIRDPAALGALSRTHATAPDGRTRRSAYEAMLRIRRGRTVEAGWMGLQERVEALSAQNAHLRERLDRLDASGRE